MKVMNYRVYYIFATAMVMLSIIFSIFFSMYYQVSFIVMLLGYLSFGVSLLGLFLYYDHTRDRVHREFVVKSIRASRSESDPLTSIYTKRKFDELLELEKERIKLFKTDSTIIGLDIDNFEDINVKFGLQIGDSVLKQFVGKTQVYIPENAVLARYDGNKFVMLLPDTDMDVAYDKTEMLRQKLNAIEFEPIGHITASYALVELTDKSNNSTIYDMINEKISLAKKKGKNTIV